MSENEATCKDCLFSVLHESNSRVCHRYPPVPMEDGRTIFPIVRNDWFCGEIQPIKDLDGKLFSEWIK